MADFPVLAARAPYPHAMRRIYSTRGLTGGQVRGTLDQPVPPPEKLTGTPLYLLDVVR
jgi:hypothetical protein